MDRIDAIVRIPPIREELLGDNWKSEYEDVACMLVLKHFPTVKFIGKLALQTLCKELIAGNSLRTAEKIVFNSRPRDPETFDLFCMPRKHRHSTEDASEEKTETTVFEIMIEKSVR